MVIASKGFRPFFFLAALFAALIVPIWLLIVDGVLAPSAYVEAWSWHAHEMIFGYATAVIAGFLLTAVGNWTQRETATGGWLVALAGVWVLGRVAMAIAPKLPHGLAAIVDLAFLPMLGVALARPIIAARNWRNLVMLVVVAVLFAANLCVHLDALGVLPLGTARRACSAAVDVIVFLVLLFTGRVVPMFTRNATGSKTITSNVWLERATLASAAALVAIDVVSPSTKAARTIAAVVALLTVARAARWGTLHTARHPLLWILHVGYAWIPFGLVLRVLPVWSSIATHALTVGAIGATTLGMMARVSLGHTGRMLVVSPVTTCGFVAITAAAIARVIVPLIALRWHFVALIVAGTLWSLAFVLYLISYTKVLTSPRVDGKPG